MGDAYLLVCYLKSWGDLPLEVFHSTRNENTHLYPLIREIYSLLPNVTLSLGPHRRAEQPSQNSAMWASPGNVQRNRETTNAANFTPFPEWGLPVYPGLPEEYAVLAPRAGKPKQRNKRMSSSEIGKVIGGFDLPVVMIGTDTGKVKGVMDLSGKTTIPEALSIISGASGFAGFQGMLAYMALSQKVPSYVYVTTKGEHNAFCGRILSEWKEYCLDIRDYKGKTWQV